MSNPALNDGAFQRAAAADQGTFEPGWAAPQAASQAPVATATDTMRLGGTITASAVLLLFLVLGGWFGWQQVTVVSEKLADGSVSSSYDMPSWLWIAWIGGFGIAVVTILKPPLARFTGPIYAVAEGLLLGAISHIFDAEWNGIVLQAVGLTMGVFVMMLVLYGSRAIKVTDRLRMGIIAATGAVCIVYLISFVLSFFGSSVPLIHGAGPAGIAFSLLVVGIAAMNLMLDFDLVERGIAARAPRYMEWYAAFGLMITLVWLYLEILRLLAKLRSR
ncbi:MAG: Bax inhibitor-1/YccA family protein [Acidimicrobiales bacterium]